MLFQTKRRRRLTVPVALALVLAVTFLPLEGFTLTASAADQFNVSSASEYAEALGSVSPAEIEINITGDFTITATTEISSDVSLTINGNGHTITQSEGAQMLRLMGGSPSVIIKDLTVECDVSSTTHSDGGAIYMRSGVVEVKNVHFSGNVANYSGGAIYVYDGMLTVSDSVFDNNGVATAISSRGGGAIYMRSGAVEVKDSCFNNNGADGSVYPYCGGAIYAADGTLTVTNSTFTGNRASSGGAIYAAAGALTVSNSTFYGNRAGSGGAIYNSNAVGAITNCTIIRNSVSSKGGGINDAKTSGDKRTTLKNCIIIGNIRANQEGSAANQNYGPDISNTLDGGNNLYGFASGFSNVASSAGGIVYTSVNWLAAGAPADNGGKTPTIALLDVSGNPAVDKLTSSSGAPDTDQRGVNRDGAPDIGAFELELVTAPAAEVINVSVSPSSADVRKGKTQQFTAEVTVAGEAERTVIWSINGGADPGTNIDAGGLLTIGAAETAETLTVTATSTYDGAKSGTVAVTVISPSPAANTEAADYAELSAAVAGASDGDIITLTADIEVTAGASFYASRADGKDITIDGQGHTITQMGTTPMFRFSYGEITFIDTKFNGAGKVLSSNQYGGSAIYSQNAAVNLIDCEFANCYTKYTPNGGTGGGGGAIYIAAAEGSLNAEGCLFVNNHAGDADVENDGGAICSYSRSPNSKITNCTFVGNYAGFDGGAVTIARGAIAITNSTFYGNTAWRHGGAIADLNDLDNGTGTLIKNTIAIGNTVESSSNPYQYSSDVYHYWATGNNTPKLDGGYNLIGKIGHVSAAVSITGTSRSGVTNTGWFDTVLRDNGGPTRTLALLGVSGSPAIDKIASGYPARDQRGFDRVGAADIGAYEYGATVSVSEVTLNKTALTLLAGESETLIATVKPDIATDKSVAWESSDTDIVTVDENGKVTAVEAGDAVITVTTVNGSQTAECAVTVTSAPASVSEVTVSPNTASVTKGEFLQFMAEVIGSNMPSQDVIWTVEGATAPSTSIAADGLLTVGADETVGELTIKAVSSVDSEKYALAQVGVLGEFYVSSGEEFNRAMKSTLNPLTIHIENDIDGVSADAITAAKTVIIYGNDHTAQQENGGVTVRMEAASGSNRLEINDLTIDGGEGVATSKNGGGAIYLGSGDVQLKNVTIKNCAVEFVTDNVGTNGMKYGGGAVSVALTDPPNSNAANGSITAENCAFINNTAGHTYDNFGGGALSADKVYLTNCTFWGNKTEDSPGGAVYARIGGSIVNCTIVNNTGLVGGGVTSRTNEVDGNRSRIHLLNSIVAGNHTKVDAVSGATASLGGKSGVNVDQVYDQGGNIFGYVHTVIDSDYRDIIYSASGETGLRVPSPDSVWQIPESREDLEKWLDYGEPKDNGGKTPTIALKDAANNPAIGKGVILGVSDVGGVQALSAPSRDQRDLERDAKPDIGAYEFTDAPTPVVLSVSVTPETAVVQKGESRKFIAAVEVWAGAAQTVTWSVSGNSSADTKIDEGGNLTAGADETTETLTVTAASTIDPTKFATATVTVTSTSTPNPDRADTSILTGLLITAADLRDSAEIGEGDGQYPQDAYEAFISALGAAQAVAEDDTAAQAAVDAAVSALSQAIADFNAAKIVVNRDTLNDLLSLCKLLYDGAVEGEDDGQYEIGSKAEFLAAIEEAQSVADYGNAAQAQLDEAKEVLETAMNIFENKKIGLNYVNYDALNALIETALNKADAAVYGEGDGQYPQDAYNAFISALEVAQAVAEDGTAAQEAVDAAVSALIQAVANFNAAKIVVNFAALDAKLAEAKAVQQGNYTEETWEDLQAAVAEAETVRGTEYVTQAEIDDALAAVIAVMDGLQAAFVSVTNIAEVPTTVTAGTPLTLTGTIIPADAANKTIIWSIKDAGSTGAAINGDTLSAAAAGTVKVTATIVHGLSENADYVQDFTITVNGYQDSGSDSGSTSGGGGGGGGSATTETTSAGSEPEEEIVEEKATPLEENPFISEHIQYLYGYEDGTIQADRTITRAEAAAIFFRLLADTNKNAYVASKFTDLESGAWYYQSVAYLNSQGIVSGYPDGSFRPNGNITRAEYAAMASRFNELAAGSGAAFYDVPNEHWAVNYINSTASKGWVSGFEDGSFRPENNVTRAQVVTIVNRMLGRGIALEDIPEWAPKYTDLTTAHWAYSDIIEASCAHQYELNEAGSEIWIQAGQAGGETQPTATNEADSAEKDTDAENAETEDAETGSDADAENGAETNTDAEDDTESAA